jgi:hypothetical protein
MQATWHALQPMHFVVSMSLATSRPPLGSRTSGDLVVVAERRMMSSDCSAIFVFLQFLDPDEE